MKEEEEEEERERQTAGLWSAAKLRMERRSYWSKSSRR